MKGLVHNEEKEVRRLRRSKSRSLFGVAYIRQVHRAVDKSYRQVANAMIERDSFSDPSVVSKGTWARIQIRGIGSGGMSLSL